MIEDIEDALTGMLEPIYEDVTIGHAEVLQIFKLRRGVIAGCRFWKVSPSAMHWPRPARNGEPVLPETKIDTLRRFDEDVNEVRTGFECGIRLATNSIDIVEGDIINIYENDERGK